MVTTPIIMVSCQNNAKGFCQVKKIPKIRQKLGSVWVGQAPTRIFIFGGNLVFFGVFLCFFMFPNFSKKKITKK